MVTTSKVQTLQFVGSGLFEKVANCRSDWKHPKFRMVPGVILKPNSCFRCSEESAGTHVDQLDSLMHEIRQTKISCRTCCMTVVVLSVRSREER